MQCKKLIYLLLVAHDIFLDYVKFPELLLISRTAFYFSLESNTTMRAPKTPVVQARFIRVAHTSMKPDNSFFWFDALNPNSYHHIIKLSFNYDTNFDGTVVSMKKKSPARSFQHAISSMFQSIAIISAIESSLLIS